MVACTMLTGPSLSGLNCRVAWGLVTLNIVILLFLLNGRGVSLLSLMSYGESLLWRSSIPLIVYGPPLSLADHRRLPGDPFAITWIWLWIGSPVALVMVVLHLFGMIHGLVVVFLLLSIRRLWYPMSRFLLRLLGILTCDVISLN